MSTTKSIGQNLKINRLFLALLLIFNVSKAYPESGADQNGSFLEQSIANYIHETNKILTAKGYRYDYKIGNIDPRLNFDTCSENLSLELQQDPMHYAQNTIKVACTGKKPWKLYIGVTIEIFGPSVIAKENIARNQSIAANMLEITETQINRSGHASYGATKPLVGMIAKRTIRKGQAIQPNHIIAPNLVDRGDQILIVAKNDMISIKMNGTALSEGTLGEQISVKNNRSKRIVKGTVVDKGRVEINL